MTDLTDEGWIDDLIDRFVNVFRGRGDVYGSAKGFCVHEPLTRAVFARHLTSINPNDHIGVYCMIGEQCSWGCIDIDGKDFPIKEGPPEAKDIDAPNWNWTLMLTLARNLQTVLANAPGGTIAAHIEKTKNGYHVWVFPEKPLVPARAMRRALMAACKAIGYDPKEVNPKAEGPRPGTKGYGNFVRLPYGGTCGGAISPRRFIDDRILDPVLSNIEANGRILDAALSNIEANRTPLDRLEACAALWTPPPERHIAVDVEAGLDIADLLPLLDGKSYTIWKDGPLPGSDRSTTLAKLAHHLYECGLQPTHAFAVLRSADARWGKFQDRPEQLERMIERAYA